MQVSISHYSTWYQLNTQTLPSENSLCSFFLFPSLSRQTLLHSLAMDESHPYFLNQADGPSLVLVSQPFNGDNYNSWSRAMVVALSVKNKLGFVDGSLPRPDDDANPRVLAAWTHSNNLVISWIYNSVSKEIVSSIMFSSSAREIWLDLQTRFQQKNGLRIFHLHKQLMSLTQGSLSVSHYFTKLKSI